MQVIETIPQLEAFLDFRAKQSYSMGFVPTMGALHQGHLSLIERARRENDLAISSVFVNPTQFNDPADFEKYPRQLKADQEKLRDAGCHAVFCPNVHTIYPRQDQTMYELGPVVQRLEGACRPGHFNGVASVVKRLLELTRPDRAYFGLKDYQQYLVIKSLVQRYAIPVEIIGCETVREPDGLAMSSRNQLLSQAHREAALALYRSLDMVRTAVKNGQCQGLQSLGAEYLSKQQGVDYEYFDIAEQDTLDPIGDACISPQHQPIALAAARVNGVRLIDNMPLR